MVYDLKKKYKGEWAIVSVSDNLLSEDLALFLVKEGFNIVLLGKDIDKLHTIE